MTSVLRDPLTHFLVLGLVIFGVFFALNDAPDAAAPDQIVITQAEAKTLVARFQATWQRPPTHDELTAMIDDAVREEVYVRGAMALGLDQRDAVIRRRLRQKMEFLSEVSPEVDNPSTETLEAYFEENKVDFQLPASVGFEQVFLGESASQADLDAAFAALTEGVDPVTLGQRSLLPPSLPPSRKTSIEGVFGPGIFEALQAQSGNEGWFGPVSSTFGVHLLRVSTWVPPRVPPFEEVKTDVEREWRAGLLERLRTQRYLEMLAPYEVVRPDPEAVLSQ